MLCRLFVVYMTVKPIMWTQRHLLSCCRPRLRQLRLEGSHLMNRRCAATIEICILASSSRRSLRSRSRCPAGLHRDRLVQARHLPPVLLLLLRKRTLLLQDDAAAGSGPQGDSSGT